MDMNELTLICEDSLEGIFTGVYDAYALKKERQIESHDRIHLIAGEPSMQRLFMEYLPCSVDIEKASKVSRRIQQICGQDTFRFLCQAAATHDEEKADAIYHMIVLGIHNLDCRVYDRLSDRYVRKVFELSRFVGNEFVHVRGFLRFQELENGILFAKIGPKNAITPFLAEHFADRLPNENFVIYDECHHAFAMHERYKEWFMVYHQDLEEERLVFSNEERDYQMLFRHFCKKLGIEERRNADLQRNMLPLRFREYMVEFS